MLIEQLRTKSSNKQDLEEAVSAVKDGICRFTGLSPEKVNIIIEKKYDNIGVFPVYTKGGLTRIFESIIKYLSSSSSNIIPEKFTNDNIRSVTLFIGKVMINAINVTPRQLVAIILHELGHVYTIQQDIQQVVAMFSRVFGILGGAVAKILIATGIITSVTHSIFLVYIFTFLTNLGLSKWQEGLEHISDSYAVKYGYGQDLMEFFASIEAYVAIHSKKTSIITRMFNYLAALVEKLIFGTSHPSNVERIQKIGDQIYDAIVADERSKNMSEDSIKTFAKLMSTNVEGLKSVAQEANNANKSKL